MITFATNSGRSHTIGRRSNDIDPLMLVGKGMCKSEEHLSVR